MDLELIWSQVDSFITHPETKPQLDESICVYCNVSKVYSHELPVCPSCGRVDFCFLSDEPEWIGDEDGPDPSRCGMPIDTVLYSEKWGMGTIIGGNTHRKMAMINSHTGMNHRDRALFHSYAQFDRVGKHTMGLPDSVMDQAKVIYRKFSEEKLTRGAVRNGIKAHCILSACKTAGVSRSYQEVADAFGIPVKDISRTTDIFAEVSGIASDCGVESNDLVLRLFKQLPMFPEKNLIKMKAIRACEDAQENPMLMSKTPKGILSAVVFRTLVECGVDITREVVAECCGVSIPTMLKIEKLL